MRTPFRKGIDSTFDFEATRIPQMKQNQGLACRISRNKHMIDPISYHVCVGRISYELLEFPLINSRNFLVMQSGVGDTGDTKYISPKLTIPRSSCIHPSTHNQENSGNHLPQPSKSPRYTSYGNTPKLPPQYWVVSRLSHQQLHKGYFRCRRNSGIPELQ